MISFRVSFYQSSDIKLMKLNQIFSRIHSFNEPCLIFEYSAWMSGHPTSPDVHGWLRTCSPSSSFLVQSSRIVQSDNYSLDDRPHFCLLAITPHPRNIFEDNWPLISLTLIQRQAVQSRDGLMRQDCWRPTKFLWFRILISIDKEDFSTKIIHSPELCIVDKDTPFYRN